SDALAAALRIGAPSCTSSSTAVRIRMKRRTESINVLLLAIPLYLFQISDRVLTSRSVDTLVMLSIAVIGAVLLQAF
ncbi:hypothetical protein ACC690_39995, partial [Rhizobium johnstonii]|uniref:hypothetical protein n=1 Tax=Rhizobium johnstonii TaxID=3019933 RepID=UPI003F9BAAFD